MNIQEAVKLAIETNHAITRADWDGDAVIDPTDTIDCCIISTNRGNSAPRWQPDAKDLIADDWELVVMEEMF